MKTTLIKNGIIITVDAADTVWQKGWIRIEDQRIGEKRLRRSPTGRSSMPGIKPCCPESSMSIPMSAVRCSRV